MSRTTFILIIVFALAITLRLAAWVIVLAVTDRRKGRKSVGLAVVGALVAVIAVAMPWYLL